MQEPTEQELKLVEIASETGLDHMMSLWNAVSKRATEELPKNFLFKDYITLQIGSCAHLVIHMFIHLTDTFVSTGAKVENMDGIVKNFLDAISSGVEKSLEERRKNMN